MASSREDSPIDSSVDDVEALILRHLPRLRAFVRLRSGPAIRQREANSDLIQSVCREILQDADRFRHGGEVGFQQWLYTTALRKLSRKAAFHHASKRDANREVPADVDGSLSACYVSFCTPSRHAIAREQLARVEAAFDSLADDYREVLVGAKLLGQSHAELAVQMDKSEGAVRTMLWRGMAQIAHLLDDGESD